MDEGQAKKAEVSWIALLIGALAFGTLIWPTAWSTSVIGGNTWRFQRFSGCSEVRTPSGWKPAGPARCDAQGLASRAREAAQVAEEQEHPTTWQPEAPDSEVFAAMDKLISRMRLTRAWADVQDNLPLFHVEVQNDSACAVDTVVLTVTDPVHGEMFPMTLDTPAGADSDSGPALPAGAHVSVYSFSDKLDEYPFQEIPVSRLKVRWKSVLPVTGQQRGCEDRAAGG